MAAFAMRTSFALLLLGCLASCNRPDNPVTSSAAPAQPPQPSEADNWQRTKDCAARVDSMPDDKPSPNSQHGRISHYSRKYGRCFVKVTDTLSVKAGSGERQTSVMLMDAFEGSIGAMLPFVGPCYLGGEQADCTKAETGQRDVLDLSFEELDIGKAALTLVLFSKREHVRSITRVRRNCKANRWEELKSAAIVR
jgi:hypothetical protein